jgi:hypothetical protein
MYLKRWNSGISKFDSKIINNQVFVKWRCKRMGEYREGGMSGWRSSQETFLTWQKTFYIKHAIIFKLTSCHNTIDITSRKRTKFEDFSRSFRINLGIKLLAISKCNLGQPIAQFCILYRQIYLVDIIWRMNVNWVDVANTEFLQSHHIKSEMIQKSCALRKKIFYRCRHFEKKLLQ